MTDVTVVWRPLSRQVDKEESRNGKVAAKNDEMNRLKQEADYK